jgi:hypothetical protein
VLAAQTPASLAEGYDELKKSARADAGGKQVRMPKIEKIVALAEALRAHFASLSTGVASAGGAPAAKRRRVGNRPSSDDEIAASSSEEDEEDDDSSDCSSDGEPARADDDEGNASDVEWEVEEIMGTKTDARGQTLYEVRWSGVDCRDQPWPNSWLPEDALNEALLADYRARNNGLMHA